MPFIGIQLKISGWDDNSAAADDNNSTKPFVYITYD
jgi:hypothetical protein